MDLVPPLTSVQSCSVQPLEDYDTPRAPLIRQVSLDEERLDDCQGHWRGPHLQGEEEERGVRLFRALLLQHLRLEELRPPPCMMAPAKPDQKGWWMYWRDWRSLERAARRFRETKAQARLAVRAEHIPLLSLDEVEFEDIMQEVCQACVHTEQRALVVLAFLCEVCARAVRVGGWCRAADWAAKHVAQCATPWAIRHGGWSTVVERAGGYRRDETTLLAGAAIAALLAFLLFCRTRLRHALIVQPLEDYDTPRAPLIRQVSLDEERLDDCQGHWRGPHLQGEEEERGVRLFRALLLQHLRLEELRPPPCMMAPAKPDQKGWWMYWRDWRSLERAARRFRETKAQARLAVRAEHIPLLSLDEVEFEDIMQEVCQACVHTEQRALVVLAFLCEVCARAVRVGGWCRAADWAAKHVAQCATPWAIRHGGWSTVVERAGGYRRDETTLLAGAAIAALLAFLLFCRTRLRHALM